MPSINNQALLVNLEVYLANNNIRRGILNVSVNAPAAGNQCVEQSFDIVPSSSLNYTCVLNNSFTIIRVTKPVTVTLIIGLQTLVFKVTSIFVYSDKIDALTITNDVVAETVTLRLIQS